MNFKPNTKQTWNQDHNSKTSAAGQPAAPAFYDQLLLVLILVLILALIRALIRGLIVLLKTLFQLIKDVWFKLQRMVLGIPNMMKRRTSHSIGMVGQSSKCFCNICFDFKAESDMFRGGKCNHPFCIDCISKHVATQIQQNVPKVNCPNPNCGVELKPEYLQPILPKEVIDRWESAKYESSIALSLKFYCPFKNCSVLLVNDGNGGQVVTSCECPSCHRLFCAQCKVPWHAGMNCKEFQKSKRSKGEMDLDGKLLELAKSKMWQRCPRCSFVIQRLGGCEHMTCRCGCNFCYKCGNDWKFGHLCNSRRST